MRLSLLRMANVFGCAIFFKGAVVYLGCAKEDTCASSKEAQAQAVIFLLYSLEIISVTEGKKDD